MAKATTPEEWADEQMYYHSEHPNESILFQYVRLVQYLEQFVCKPKNIENQSLLNLEFSCILEAVKCHLAFIEKAKLDE